MQERPRNSSVMELTDPLTGLKRELAILTPSLGPQMIDMRGIKEATGRYVFDPGLTATGICRSAITYVDGDNGVLLYRGYPIDQLVERSDFMEVAWILLNAEITSDAHKSRVISQ